MIKTKLIKTEREYQSALRRVEKLTDARPGTPRGDEPRSPQCSAPMS